MGSIGNMLGVDTFNSQSFDWKSLNKVHDGTYNMGEVTSSFKNGKITFDKVNNHISKSNNKVVSGSDNKRTNAAVFMSILTTYGIDTSNAAKFNEKISTFMTTNVDKVNDAIFDDIKNPFVKEAFNFLLKDELGGARPLSRDELHVLFELLKKGIGGEEAMYAAADVDVEAGMQRLQNLRKLKAGELQEGSEERTNALKDLKGMKVENISASKKSRLESVSVNQAAGTRFLRPISGAETLSREATVFLNREFEDYANFYASKKKGVTTKDVCNYIANKATDPEFQKKVNALLGDYCNPVQLDDVNEVEMYPCTKNPFSTVMPKTDKKGKVIETNSGSNGFEQIAKQGKKAIVQVAADATYFSGTFSSSGQEEGHCRDMSPVMFAILIAKGYIEPVKNKNGQVVQFKYALNEQGEPKLNPWKGYYIQGFKNATDFKPNADGAVHAVTYLFTAGTSFGTGINCDKNGFRQVVYEVNKNRTDIFPKGDNTCKAEMFARLGRFHDVLRHWTDRLVSDRPYHEALVLKEKKLNRKLTEEEIKEVVAKTEIDLIERNEKKLKRKLTEEERAKVLSQYKPLTKDEDEKFGFLHEDAAFGYGTTKYPCTKFSEMMRIAMLAQTDKFNVFGDEPEKEAAKLLELMRSGNYKDILNQATEKFHEVQNSQNQGWIKLALAAAEKTGATALQTCNVGGGYFYNAVDDFPESWTSNWAVFGSDKELIMSVYDANAAEEVPTWESNINTAMAKQTEKVD